MDAKIHKIQRDLKDDRSKPAVKAKKDLKVLLKADKKQDKLVDKLKKKK